MKCARYGAGGLILLAFAEVTGESRNETRSYFTVVVDTQGAVCQPKAPLASEQSLTSGDDFVRRPNGTIVWASLASDALTFVTLTPG